MGLGSPVGSSDDELAADAAETGRGFDPWVGRSPGVRNVNLLQILIWGILWTEEPGGLWPISTQRVGHD